MTISATSSNATINAYFASEHALNRLRGSAANSAEFIAPTRKTARIQPDPRRQTILDEQSQSRGRKQNPQETAHRTPGPETSGRPLEGFAAATLLTAQLLGQPDGGPLRPGLSGHEQSLKGHRDAAEMGTALYRQNGGEPEILSDRATFLSLAV